MNNIFKLLAVTLLVISGGNFLLAQKIEPIPVKQFYKDRVTRNLQFLCKEEQCLDNVRINDRGLYIYSTNQKVNEPEFIHYWREMPHFVQLLEDKSDEEIIDILKRKGKHYFYGIQNTHVNPARYPVSKMHGLKVAIDPGHMAATFEEAQLEKRYVKVEGNYYNQKNDLTFFEANLAYATSLVLKDMLEAKGANVMLTHDYGKSAFGMNFAEWKETDYKEDIIFGYKNDWYNREKFRHLMSGDATDHVLFHDVFRNLDFVKRAERINAWNPDITLVIHLNASENNRRYGDKYLRPVPENYSMVFIPGGFLGFEVDGSEQTDQRFELLRLLVSHDLEESDIFARNIILALHNQLNVDALPADNDFVFANDYSVKSDLSDGVYHRNLYLTRVVEGPIAYAEVLYQDNVDEVPLLGKKDFKINGIVSSSRVKEIASVFYSAIEDWLEYNKEYAKKLDALYEDKYGDEMEFEEDIKMQRDSIQDN
ncbi:MAG: N-acetylmuramoyl-L-alanine amidase [Fulvivirga sp.]|nr:N-acetylmuramoyl-L-alanine amidase [Fulvivirga sp.]